MPHNLSRLFLALGLIAAAIPGQAAEKMRIHGVEVEVEVLSQRPARAGGVTVHAVRLLAPQVFQFAGDHKIELSGQIFLHDNGNIWMSEGTKSKAPLVWTTASGRVILNCSERPVMSGVVLAQRSIQFHDNGQYMMGCESHAAGHFQTEAGGSVEIEHRAVVDLNRQGELKYASVIKGGHLVLPQGRVDLRAGSEIAFFESGKPAFFTVAEGNSVSIPISATASVQVYSASRGVSTSLFENGWLERGLVATDYRIESLGLQVPRGSSFIFEQNLYSVDFRIRLSAVRLSLPQTLKVESYSLQVIQLELAASGEITSLVLAEGFTFMPSEPGAQPVQVAAGSKISLASNGRISLIEMPSRP